MHHQRVKLLMLMVESANNPLQVSTYLAMQTVIKTFHQLTATNEKQHPKKLQKKGGLLHFGYIYDLYSQFAKVLEI
ncbi:CLUMA_CG000345, isoform A [Clunio marinus]|uniref:CLUMA_CG000345, isoform A n=1 Tax=Clunio marinus TaxID=568069 RepID=A0A1J1HFE5_9DIPT|nr:CLUMA_CG000345, isoform A [Clunio marinus]